jgi:hypothetical protein
MLASFHRIEEESLSDDAKILKLKLATAIHAEEAGYSDLALELLNGMKVTVDGDNVFLESRH